MAAAAMAVTTNTSCHNHKGDDALGHHHHGHEAHDEHEEHEEHGGHEGHEGHDHGHGDEIILEPERAKLMGVKTMTVSLQPFNNVIKVSGEIETSAQGSAVASAPTSGIVSYAPGIVPGKQVGAGTVIATVKASGISGGDPNALAKANVQAAQKEVERLKPLHDNGIVSTAEYNAAVAALNAAKAAYSPVAASGRIVAPVAGIITTLDVKEGQFVDAGAPVAAISGGGALTLRADLPQRYYNEMPSITGAKIKTPYNSEILDITAIGGSRVTSSLPPRAGGAYLPVYFSIPNNNVALVPGTAVEVFLQGAPREKVVTVPVSALSEQQGNYYVYIKVDDEGYLKSPVTLGQSNGEAVEVLSGVHPGDVVVYECVTAVRLAEASGVIPEGHNHNH